MNIFRSSSGLIILFLFLVAVGVGLWWRLSTSKENQYDNPSAQYYKDLEQRYAGDTYGGSTPEETLELFIAALEAGNIDLASKYFVIEKQEEWKKNLDKIKKDGLLEAMKIDLKKLNDKYPLTDKQLIFEARNQNDELILQATIVQIQNGKWKIQSL